MWSNMWSGDFLTTSACGGSACIAGVSRDCGHGIFWLERGASCSQTRRDTNFAIPGYSISAMIPRRTVKIKFFLSVVIPVVKAAFVPPSVTGESPANAGVARLCGVSPHPIPDTTTALPKQARYQLRYTPIRYSLCIANPFLTALIVYWILAGKSTGRLHIPPE